MIFNTNMTRHAKNCTAGAFYTYSEKKKDASASGYGTSSQRLGKDSMNSFDCCALTLQPCQNPVITKDGYLFEKSAILEYIITKKREYARNLKEYNRCKESQVDSTLNSSNAIINKLDKISKSLIEATTLSNNSNNNDNNSISNMANGMDKKLPSFWVPSETPNNKLTLPKAPNSNIYCPVSNKPLRVKDLIDVKFTLVNEKDKNSTSLILSQSRYKCPITHDILSNSVACAVLKPT